MTVKSVTFFAEEKNRPFLRQVMRALAGLETMSDKRNDIAKLIEKIRVDQKLIDQLRPPAFESMVAELFSQNQALVEAQRNMAQQLDFVGKFRDEFNHINSFAVEVKKLNSLIDTSAIEQFRNSISSLGIDKGYFVATSGFSEAAKALASQHQETLKLIDRSALSSLIDQYTVNRELFASNLFEKAWSLDLDKLVHISSPSPEEIEELGYAVSSRRPYILWFRFNSRSLTPSSWLAKHSNCRTVGI